MIKKIGTLGQVGGPLLVDRILTNSITVRIADSVQTTAGFGALSAAASRVLGHVESFIGPDGLTPVKDGTFLGNLDSAFTTTASNQTVAQVRARVDIDTMALYSADMSAALGTTAGSDQAGKTFNLTDARTVNEASVAVTLLQYSSHGRDRNDSTNLIVNVLRSEVFGF